MRLHIPPDEVEITAIRAQGAGGGQNVNKVSNAAHLRFDIAASSLPEEIRERRLKQGSIVTGLERDSRRKDGYADDREWRQE